MLKILVDLKEIHGNEQKPFTLKTPIWKSLKKRKIRIFKKSNKDFKTFKCIIFFENLNQNIQNCRKGKLVN